MSEVYATRRSTDREAPPTPALDVLADRQRRTAVAALLAADAPLTVDELSDRIAEDDEAARLAIRLHHEHLPKLANAGVLEYDAGANVARPTEQTAALAPLVEAASA